jgi:hypothetical protein
MIPPGDIRNCLAALSAPVRIADIVPVPLRRGDGLNGHAIGNLLIAALADVTQDFARRWSRRADARRLRRRAAGDLGTRDAGRRVQRRARAERRDGDCAAGRHDRRSACCPSGRVSRRVIDALRAPTSSSPARQPLHEHPAAAARARRRRRDLDVARVRILVANLMTEAGETDNFSVLDHLLTIVRTSGGSCSTA